MDLQLTHVTLSLDQVALLSLRDSVVTTGAGYFKLERVVLGAGLVSAVSKRSRNSSEWLGALQRHGVFVMLHRGYTRRQVPVKARSSLRQSQKRDLGFGSPRIRRVVTTPRT